MANILVVDDATFMRKRISKVLNDNGHTVAGEAENGQEAIDLYKKLKPDLTILDITMPILSGQDALKEIISLDPSAKVVMCSALGSKEIIADCIYSGAKSYITKPYDEEKIIDVLDKVLVA